MSGDNSRKRPLQLDDTVNNATDTTSASSRATHAQDFKRRQIQQASWGFRQVLSECGLLEFDNVAASPAGGNDGDNNPPEAAEVEVGCRLEPKVSSSTLRSSLDALLDEMSKNGIDPGNARVLKDMEDIVLGVASGGGSGDDNEEGNSVGNSLLRRMLLPLHRVRTTRNKNDKLYQQQRCDFTQFSQFSQSPNDNGNGNSNNDNITTRSITVVESSSLIKVLLRVDALQTTLLTALLSKLPELASSSDDENDTDNEQDMPRLIFANLRWLDHIIDYPSLTHAYVECLTILASGDGECETTRGVLLDAIGTLPDVLNDCGNCFGGGASFGVAGGGENNGDNDTDNDENEDEEGESNPILSTLQSLRITDPTLLIPCLDAIGSLPLTSEEIDHAVRDALEALANVETWGLPALVGFLMNHCPTGSTGSGSKEMGREVIDELRKLPLGSNGNDDTSGEDVEHLNDGRNRETTSASSSAAASASLMIESLSRGLAHRPDLTSTLLKSIKDTSSSEGHPPADIWLLAACATAPHNRAKVKGLFKNKANAGMFTSRLLRESLSGNGVALGSLFGTSLCDLADGLLRSGGGGSSFGGSSDAAVVSASSGGGTGGATNLGITLYTILFEEFSEPMQRQEIVGSLVTHVGSGVGVNGGEVDAALRVFCNIVDKMSASTTSTAKGVNGTVGKEESGAMALRPFTPFLTSMLDHLHHMSSSQVRRLFLLLFAVGYGNNSGGDDGDDINMGAASAAGAGGGACDDVHIVIRKHLSLGPFAMKRIGIIGTVAYAVSRSSQLQPHETTIIDDAETETTCLPNSSAAVASSPIVQEIKDMIDFAYVHCKPAGGSIGTSNNNNDSSMGASFSNGSAMAFMLDELCHAVRGGRLAFSVREWIDELVQSDFENFFVGDFEETDLSQQQQKEQKQGTKGAGKGGKRDTDNDAPIMEDQTMIPTSPTDLALLNGTSALIHAPPSTLRFNIAGAESVVYVKITSLLSSSNRTEREVLPVQLSPMFRLMSTLSDVRFGGKGLSEIDAMLECPLLLPTVESSGMEFEELSSGKQWVVTSSYFFGTCWVRQLINSFIYAAYDEGGALVAGSAVGATAGQVAGTFTSSSQGFNCEEVQKKIVARLKALVELEEELRFTSSKCFVFAPPGLDILPAPKELYDNDNYPNDNMENLSNTNTDSKSMSKEDKKALATAKKLATKRVKDRVKSKQRQKKAKHKHEEQLVNRTLSALRQLDPHVCVALGFADLSVMGNNGDDMLSSGCSQGLSQHFQQVTTCGGPVTTLLLKLLQKALSDSLSEKKGVAFKARMEGITVEEDVDNDNPYDNNMAKEQSASTVNVTNFADIALASCESKKSFSLLDTFLKGGVFASLYEHLAAVAELRCGPNRKNDDAEMETQLVETARCLFSCVRSLMSSKLLTRSATGRFFLASVLKQIAEGDREDYNGSNDNKKRHHRPSVATMNKLMGFVMDNVNEIVTGAYTGDLEFAMDGVNCMQAIFECLKRISDADEVKDGEEDGSTSFPTKLSEVADKLLRQNWPDDTKMNKGNVGKLLSLSVEHSPNRMKTLSHLVTDVLQEVPFLEKGKGVTIFPTCSHPTFGNYYSTVLEYLWKELVNLFDSPTGKTKDPYVAARALDHMKEMIGLLQSLFDLTKENDALAKRIILLQQLKFGSRFIETFVLKAIPFFQVHFQQFEETILDIIRLVQKWSRQLYHIISHGKREKDASLAKEAPRAKKALEMFIHKVKAMLKKNGCMTAMWTKTLKAKDIDGTTLKGENTSKEDEEEGDSADEDNVEGDNSDEEDDASSSADTSEDEYDTDDE